MIGQLKSKVIKSIKKQGLLLKIFCLVSTMRTLTIRLIHHLQIHGLFRLCACMKKTVKSHAGKSFNFCLSFISRNVRNRRQRHFRPKTMAKQDSLAVQIPQNPNVIFVLTPEESRH